ncbi:hypothetical protein pb186bvf_005821 [Paramecium bursaria]
MFGQSDQKQLSIFENQNQSQLMNISNLQAFLDFTNQFQLNNSNDKPIQLPTFFQQQPEPRYVNQKQYKYQVRFRYHRIMVRRIQRAQQNLRFQDQKQQQKQSKPNDKKYVYESRHQHAVKRKRGPDGKFVKKAKQTIENDQKKLEQFSSMLEGSGEI